VAQVEVVLTASDQYDLVYYTVFDNSADASADFNGSLVDHGYQQTGSFSVSGVADPARCFTEGLPAQGTVQAVAGSLCFVRSGYVVTDVATQRITTAPAGNTPLTKSLIRDSVRTVARIAAGSTPPTTGARLSPDALAGRLLAAHFTAREMLSPGTPWAVTSPTYTDISLGANRPRGEQREVSVHFSGPDKYDNIAYYIFRSDAAAAKWMDLGLEPTGSTSTGSIDSSGFNEDTRCSTFHYATPPAGASACYSLVGNVVIEAYTGGGTSAQAANNDLTVTMQRMGLFHLYRVIGRRL
jgi:hypothetical protein